MKHQEELSLQFGSFASFKGSSSPFAAILSRVINITSKHLLSNLTGLQINHVSPLRAFPQRYYLLDKSVHHRKLNALDGTELAEVLKNNPTIKDSINILFAPFNIGIDIEKVNDIIYKIVVNQDDVNLELTDVGFGISQVLPILVQAYLSPPGSLTIIEQPEIHLHPNMQAWLTDAIITIALKERKRFLIETHSDALIRRVRLRIVDDSSQLVEDDVKIYHLHRDKINRHTLLDDIQINDNGDIKWPKDFMDVEIRDTIQIQQLKFERLNKESEVKAQ
nr:AAA family ATPase [Pseudomonas sp. B329]